MNIMKPTVYILSSLKFHPLWVTHYTTVKVLGIISDKYVFPDFRYKYVFSRSGL